MRKRRQARIHAKIRGTGMRPRLAVFRSHTALYVQLIDDEKRETIASASVKGKNTAKAQELGSRFAEIVKKRGVRTVIFDRGGSRYHGVIQALADSVRKGGILF